MIPKKLCPCTKHEETIIRGVNQGIGRQLSKIVIINGRKVPAIIDCGANVNYVNKAWSEEIGIKAKDYGEASVRAYSGREIKERLSIASIEFSFNGKWMKHEFRVLGETGSDKMVLGIPWLREENPTIDWRKETITLIEERIKTEMVSIKGLLNRNENYERKSIHEESKEYEEKVKETKERLPEKLHEFLDVFIQREYELPEHGPYDLAIRLKEGAKLPKQKQRRYTREEALEIKKQLTELLRQGKVRESRSDSAVGTLFVPKADGSKRWCMDMRPVNNATIPDENKSPLQDISRERLRGAKIFTRLDMKDGYHHLRIREGGEKHTAFITEYGLFEWTVACFGLRNAPAEFARFMSNILIDYINDFVVVYFDDIVIYSRDEKEHEEHVRRVLEKLKKAKINLKIKKCEFGVKETNFLGHVMTGDTIRMQEEKIQVILKWPTPRNLKDLERFKGMVGYYRQYIGHFTDIMRKINEKLRRKEFSWNEEDEKIFQDVKNRFKDNQIMGIFDWEKRDNGTYRRLGLRDRSRNKPEGSERET